MKRVAGIGRDGVHTVSTGRPEIEKGLATENLYLRNGKTTTKKISEQ